MEVKTHKLSFIVSWKWRLLFQEKMVQNVHRSVSIRYLNGLDSLLWHWICWKSIYFLWLFHFIFHLFMLSRMMLSALILLKLIERFAGERKRGWGVVWCGRSCLHCAFFGNLGVWKELSTPWANPITLVNFTWNSAERKTQREEYLCLLKVSEGSNEKYLLFERFFYDI